jgi:hypothetical protein
MARAGYCSACGNYVFLRADGGCGNGHGPEYVSNPYEVPEAPAPGYPPPAQPAYQPAAYQPPPAQPGYPQPAYQPQAYAVPVQAPPKRKRTGLVVTIVIVLLLLLCGCGAVAAIALGVVPNPMSMLSSPEHQKVQAAGTFFKAISTADLVALPRSIPSAAAAAANPAFWTEKVLTATDKATFNSESWNGDVLTQDYTDAEGVKRGIVYTAAEGDKVSAIMSEGGQPSGDPILFTMVSEVGGWKVLAVGSPNGEDFLRFTPEAIKALESENP